MIMKILFVIAFFCLSIITNAQSYEILGRDTINLTDANGMKQGKWIQFGRYQNLVCSNSKQITEEGVYKNNKRTGLWIEYFCNGNFRNKITYTDGRPDGYKIIYRENGTVLAEGNWKFDHWVGKYKVICDDGKAFELEGK